MRNSKRYYIIKEILSIITICVLGSLAITFSVSYVETFNGGILYEYSNLLVCSATAFVCLLTVLCLLYLRKSEKLIFKLTVVVVIIVFLVSSVMFPRSKWFEFRVDCLVLVSMSMRWVLLRSIQMAGTLNTFNGSEVIRLGCCCSRSRLYDFADEHSGFGLGFSLFRRDSLMAADWAVFSGFHPAILLRLFVFSPVSRRRRFGRIQTEKGDKTGRMVITKMSRFRWISPILPLDAWNDATSTTAPVLPKS